MEFTTRSSRLALQEAIEFVNPPASHPSQAELGGTPCPREAALYGATCLNVIPNWVGTTS